MLENVKMTISEELSEEELKFLKNESFNLFCKTRNYPNLTEENILFLKENLEKMYLENLSNIKIYTVKFQEEIIGCATLLTDSGYLRDIFVKDKYQRQGIGTLILKQIIKDMAAAKKVTLTAHPSVIDFYKQNGFEVIESTKHDVVMKKYNR